MSLSSRRLHREEPPQPASTAAARDARDWAELPRDILLDIFFKLGPREVMLDAEFACTAWRRVAIEEPTLWRRVGMDPYNWLWRCIGEVAERAMRFAAMERAAGKCEAFRGHCDDENLMYLVRRAPCLKSLDVDHWSYYDEQSGKVLVAALSELTLLEDLQIKFTYRIDGNDNLLQSVCQACPQLKRLVLTFVSAIDRDNNEDEFCCLEPIDGEIPMMHELCCLELFECELSAKGLKSILNSCPLLQTLHIEDYISAGKMDNDLMVKCARVKKVILSARIKTRG